MAHIFQVGIGASQDRLEKLIEARLAPGADKAEIDQRIWDLFGETWAVMFTDLAGFSRNVTDFGIIHFLQTIHESHRLLVPCIERFDGVRRFDKSAYKGFVEGVNNCCSNAPRNLEH